MKAITTHDYSKYIGQTIFKYQFFQTYKMFVDQPLKVDNAVDYYINEDDVKQRQAYEMHCMMAGTYKAYNKQENQASDFFKRFVDERDIDFFVSSVSNHQMNEVEYFKYISLVEKDFPEKLI